MDGHLSVSEAVEGGNDDGGGNSMRLNSDHASLHAERLQKRHL